MEPSHPRILLEPAPPPAFTSSVLPLRELEVLLIICAIIFMALMLLGIGCSYYCLKKRNIKVAPTYQSIISFVQSQMPRFWISASIGAPLAPIC